jgi:site-specific recombinase XerD
MARACILVMLYSGLRISDTVRLKRGSVDVETKKVFLRVMKTGVPLYVTLQPSAVEVLDALPKAGEYFFWNGKSKLYTAAENARKSIQHVLALADVEGHPHRFRDIFSVRLLECGEDLRTVQLLLGHTSIRTTEKHCAPFVRSFQRILDGATSKVDFEKFAASAFWTWRWCSRAGFAPGSGDTGRAFPGWIRQSRSTRKAWGLDSKP